MLLSSGGCIEKRQPPGSTWWLISELYVAEIKLNWGRKRSLGAPLGKGTEWTADYCILAVLQMSSERRHFSRFSSKTADLQARSAALGAAL